MFVGASLPGIVRQAPRGLSLEQGQELSVSQGDGASPLPQGGRPRNMGVLSCYACGWGVQRK